MSKTLRTTPAYPTPIFNEEGVQKGHRRGLTKYERFVLGAMQGASSGLIKNPKVIATFAIDVANETLKAMNRQSEKESHGETKRVLRGLRNTVSRLIGQHDDNMTDVDYDRLREAETILFNPKNKK